MKNLQLETAFPENLCKASQNNIVCTPPPFLQGGGELNIQPNFQKEGGLDKTSLLEGGCWERGGDFFQGEGGLQFSLKNKLKSEIFNEKKKVNKQKYFSLP